MLPAWRATDVVDLSLVICVAQNASTIMHGFEIEEEILSSCEVGNIIANSHTLIVVGARGFTSERVKSRVPICLVKRIT